MKFFILMIMSIMTFLAYGQSNDIDASYMDKLVDKQCKNSISKVNNEEKGNSHGITYKTTYKCKDVDIVVEMKDNMQYSFKRHSIILEKNNKILTEYVNISEKEINHINFLLNSNISNHIMAKQKNLSSELSDLIK